MISRALADARVRAPYYARALAAMTPVERPGLGTLAVDRSWRLYWDPEFCARITRAELAAVVLHEVEHLLRDHAGRRQGRSPRAWNVAADAEINDDLEGLPEGGVYPSTLGAAPDLSAEEYYSLVADDAADPQCGSGSGGDPVPGELDDESEAPGVAPGAEADRLRDAVAEDVRAAAARGDVPASARLWASARLIPVRRAPDWGARVRAHIGSRGDDWTWSRLPRRQPPRGILRPGRARQSRELAVVVDLSGSMAGHADAVASVLSSVRADVLWLYGHDCAATAAPATRARSWRDVLTLPGGGGTDLRPAIERAAREHQRVLVLTDGDTPWPSPMPAGVLALILGPDGTWEAR